jgi:hypothetical protein
VTRWVCEKMAHKRCPTNYFPKLIHILPMLWKKKPINIW